MGFEYVPEKAKEYKITLRDQSKGVSERPVFVAPVMRDVMCAPFESFTHLGTLGESADKKHPGRHIYIDRGSKVLGVAHLDSVKEAAHFWTTNDVVGCPTIDNRLGAWILLHGLPSIGIYPDVLLTENEEKGMSTAGDYKPTEVRHNWMFSFDRMGTDVVLYQYGLGSLEKALKNSGFTIGHGSYSCIAELEHLGIQGMNVGCTMADYHSNRAHAHLPRLADQLMAFAAFFKAHEDEKFEWSATKWTRSRSKRNATTTITHYNNYGYGGYDDMEHYNGGPGVNQHKDYEKHRKTDDLVRRFRLDAHEMETIIRLGVSQFFDECDSIGEWRANTLIPAGAEADVKGYVSYCKDCTHKYRGLDTRFSSFYASSFCKACWMERMDWLQLTPSNWQAELALYHYVAE